MDLSPRRFADTVVLHPADRIDHATAETFQSALATHLARCADGEDRLVLDLSGVEYIASVGLRALMLAAKHAKARRGTFVVAGMQPVVQEILEISRFTMILLTFASVREALAQVSPPALAAFDAAR
jgi:anti-anti-sigma factor